MSISRTPTGASSPRAQVPRNASFSSQSAGANLPPAPAHSEEATALASRSGAEGKISNEVPKPSSVTDANTAKSNVPVLKLRSLNTPSSVPAFTVAGAAGALHAVNASTENTVSLGAIPTADALINRSPRTPAHRQSAERREEQVKKRKEAQRIESEGVSTGDDVIGLWHICLKKLELKAEEINVTEKLLQELSGTDISAMNAEGLIELIGFLSRTISPGEFRHFRAVLSQLKKQGEVLLAGQISPFFIMLLNGIGQFDMSKTDEENAVSMAREIALMSSYLNRSYGLTRAYERALQVMETESVLPVHVQTENAEQQASPRAGTKKSGGSFRRSMTNLFAPKSEKEASAEDAPKSPRSKGKDKKSGDASRRSFTFHSPRSSAAPSSPRENDAADDHTVRVGEPSVSPRARAGTVTTAMLRERVKNQTTTQTTTTATSATTSTATNNSTVSSPRVPGQAATMSPRRKPLPASLFADGGIQALSSPPRVTAAVTTPAVGSPARETSVAGKTSLADVRKLFRAQQSAFVEKAGAQSTPESAARQHGLIDRVLEQLDPSLSHATLAMDVRQAMLNSRLTYEEMTAFEKSCGNCHGWFGGGEEAEQLERILMFVAVYVGRFKPAS